MTFGKHAVVASVFALGLAAQPALAQRISPNSGVTFADQSKEVEGPKTIAGAKNYESPLPFFKDLKAWDPNYRAPRTPDGHPDFQGVWSSAALTTMTRGGGRTGNHGITTLTIPQEKINEVTGKSYYTRAAEDSQKRTDPNAGVFKDRDVDAGYNAFWIDPGSEYAKINGEYRSSWIVSPADGQLPLTPAGRTSRGARMEAVRKVNNTGPEIRTNGDRCLISFGNQGGPPLNNAMYNNHIRFVQTPDHLMLEIEMNHDARVIPIRKQGQEIQRRPGDMRPWFGDSVGWWEGETLVVETRHLHPIQSNTMIPISKEGVVTERFKRVSPVEIFYSFEVNDPVNYTQPWKGEMPLRQSKEQVFEYACHEGNYALSGILRGDAEERDTAIDQDGE